MNALARISTGHRRASLGIPGVQWALRASLVWAHGGILCVDLEFYIHKKTERPIPIKCSESRNTGASARRVDIRTVFSPWQRNAWDSSLTRGVGAGATQDPTRRIGGPRTGLGDVKMNPVGTTGLSVRT